MAKAKAPTHTVICCREGDETWHEIGVAWEDDGGKFRVAFPPTTLIDRAFIESHTIRMYPRKRSNAGKEGDPVQP